MSQFMGPLYSQGSGVLLPKGGFGNEIGKDGTRCAAGAPLNPKVIKSQRVRGGVPLNWKLTPTESGCPLDEA